MKKMASILIAAFTLTACATKDPMENFRYVKTACLKSQQFIGLPYVSMSSFKEDDEKKDKVKNSACSLSYSDKQEFNVAGRFLTIDIIGDNQANVYSYPEWNEYHVTYVTLDDTKLGLKDFNRAVFIAARPIAKSKLTLFNLLHDLETDTFFNKLDSGEIEDLSAYVKEEYKVTIRKFKSEIIDGTEFVYIMRIEAPK